MRFPEGFTAFWASDISGRFAKLPSALDLDARGDHLEGVVGGHVPGGYHRAEARVMLNHSDHLKQCDVVAVGRRLRDEWIFGE